MRREGGMKVGDRGGKLQRNGVLRIGIKEFFFFFFQSPVRAIRMGDRKDGD